MKPSMTDDCVREQIIKFFNNNCFSPLSAVEYIEELDKNTNHAQNLRKIIMEYRTLLNDFHTNQTELIYSVVNLEGYKEINTIFYIKLYSILIAHFIEKQFIEGGELRIAAFDKYEIQKGKSSITIVMNHKKSYYEETSEGATVINSIIDFISSLGLCESLDNASTEYTFSLGKYLGIEICVKMLFISELSFAECLTDYAMNI